LMVPLMTAGRIWTLMVVLAFSLAFFGENAFSADRPDRRTGKVSVYDVPTTGKILDVEYRPEFDEWWVKCREGENIAVYSYDNRTQKWGRVQFIPHKPEEKAKGPEMPGKGVTESGPAAPVAGKGQEPGKGVEPRSDAQQKPPEKEQKKTDTKWWDPLNVLKGGERVIKSLEGGK
jgi:hypothetical protein